MTLSLQRLLRILLFSLILTLVFEGVVRKLVGGSVSSMLIFLKDFIVMGIAVLVLQLPKRGYVKKLFSAYIILCLALIPLFIRTVLADPVLFLFGAKQYLLFPFVAFAVPMAYDTIQQTQPTAPFRLLTLLIYPTAILSLLQQILPETHWLNLSVTGEDLRGFSAAGELRVSSTFSFVAQYCWYLLAAFYGIVISFTWMRLKDPWRNLFRLTTLLLFIMSLFITGSRTSVMGAALMLFIGGMMLLIRLRTKHFMSFIGITVVIFLGVNLLQAVYPDAFVVYEERQGSSESLVEDEEVQKRIYDAYFRWLDINIDHPLGYGLGTMSNGVQKISTYASEVRENILWGETDLQNTVLEGGYYLVIIWMAFRIYVIILCFRLFDGLRLERYIFAGAFVFGHVVLMGINGTIGIQPPIAIWWWLSVGAMILLRHREYKALKQLEKIKERSEKSSAMVQDPAPA